MSLGMEIGLGTLCSQNPRDTWPPCLERADFGEVLLQGTVWLGNKFVSAFPVDL